MSHKSSQSGSAPDTVTIAVLGVSGTERVKGAYGVGKSLLCNRFIRGDYDNFQLEHSSILSQASAPSYADFSGSPVINNDHWLYWGEALLNNDDLYANANVRLIEQTEFVDDETFEALSGANEEYAKRATRLKLESADKLMYICKEQLGLEAEFAHQILPEGRCSVDGFVFVYDVSTVEGRSFEMQSNFALSTLQMAIKTKKPIAIAASKMDSADENGKKALQRLLARKELKSSNIPTVEVSAFADINVTNLFAMVTSLVEKWKVKPKLLTYVDAYNQQKRREREICERYVAVLRELMPVENWPQRKPTWTKLLSRMGLARHIAYTHFVYVFGRMEAKKLYQKHVNEAREIWMQRRLQTQTPRLTRVFADLIGAERARTMKWVDAKEAICSHPLFDEYFQPLGTLAADLDPSSPQVERNLNDSRIPAELLLTTEAEPTYYEFQRMVDREYRRERMEEQFEQMLAQCPQVTPGKPLQEVEIFLRGNAIYDALPPQLAFNIYDRYQEVLVKKAEAEFVELLLERVQLFVDVVIRRRQQTHTMRPLLGLDDAEMSDLRSVLHEDTRYRQLNRLFEFRDKMLSNYASFVSYPLIQNCPSGNRCIDTILHDIFHSHLQRRQFLDSSQILRINVVVVGDDKLSCDFIFAISKLLNGDILEHERGVAQVKCVREKDTTFDAMKSRTFVYLVDSIDSLNAVKQRQLSSVHFGCPPIIVLLNRSTVDDSTLQFLHQQCYLLATNLGGIFVGIVVHSMPTEIGASGNEMTAFFDSDHLSHMLDAAFSSQIDGRRLDARIQLSLMCGDQFPAQCVLNSLLSITTNITPSSSGGMGTIEVPIVSLKRSALIDLRASSYHSWLVSRAPLPIHGHILAYSARRRASFAHARAAAKSLLETPNASSASKPSSASSSCTAPVQILFIAVADVTDFFNDEETNALLTEGSELATKLSASFVTLSPEIAERLHTVTFVEFFERVLCAQHHIGVGVRSSADGATGDYGTVPEVNPSNPLHWTFDTATTHSDCCTATTSRESTSSRNSSSRPLNQPHSSHLHQHQPQYPHQSLNQAVPPQPIHRQPVLNQRSNSVASTSSTTVIPDIAHTSNCATSSAIAATPITTCHRQPASAIGLSEITDSVVISDSSNISAVSQPSLSVPSERCPLANASASTSHLLNVNKSTSRTLPLFESTASSPSTSVLPQKSLKTTSASALRSLPSQLSKAEIKQTPFAESAVQFTIPPHLPLSSDDDALAYSMGSQHMAPLATPEHIEIASDYMTVKDALGCGEEDTEEEDCAYATLDFSSCSSNATPIGDINTNLTTASSSKTTSTRRSPTVANHAKNLIAHLPKRHPTTAASTATASSSPAAQSPQSKTSANLQSASVSSSSSASLNQPSSSTGDIASSVLPVSHHQQNSRHDCNGKTNDSHKGETQIATQSIIISASVPSTNLTAAKQHRRADKSPLARQPQINVEAHAANDNAAISVRTNRVPNMAALNPQTEAPKSKRLQLQRKKAPPLIKTKLVPQTAGRGSAIPAIHRLHSISAESLVDVGLINSTNLYGHISRAGDEFASTDAGSPSSAKKFSKNRFVRKMASSFRFRRGTPHAVNNNGNTNGNNDNDGSCLNASSPSRQSTKVKKILLDDGMIIVDVNDAASATSTENDEKLNDSDIGDSDSRSVPHSPHSERRHHHASVLFNRRREPPSSSEKISNAFSWLPSRSPKRSAARNVTPESTTAYRLNGVVSTSDTLSSLAASSPDSVPFFVKKCIEYIEKVGGLETEGLYRVPGNQAQVIDLERAFVADNSIDLECLSLPVHVVATALKNFLSALPEPLIPYDMHDKLVSLLDVAQDEASNRIRETLESWPLANHNTTIYLLEHLARVASHSDINSMDIRNLSKVWWPTLFRPNFDSFQSMAVFVTRLELATQLLIRASSDQQQQQQ